MAEALTQVKSVMGRDAIILHTRTFKKSRWLGLGRREMVEITAGRGLNMINQQRRSAARSAVAPPQPAPVLPPAAPASPTGAYAAAAGHNPRGLLGTPAADRAIAYDISNQMATLKGMVKDLTEEIHRQQKPTVPEELFEIYTTLINRRVNDKVCGELILGLQRVLRPDQYHQADVVRQKTAELIEKMIPVGGPIQRTKISGPHVIALIGPTGVGKTTTIAKLAANFKLRDRMRVGLITIDTYRIAAIDQLKKYADIIGSELKVVASPDDLKAAVEGFADCDYVLIDTAGRSPNDALKLNELKGFLAAAKPDEVHVVVAATVDQACAELAIERFGDVRIDRLIFTKLDEAPDAGVLLNVVHKMKKPLSYITTGQDVPDDIEDTRASRLANRILGNNV